MNNLGDLDQKEVGGTCQTTFKITRFTIRNKIKPTLPFVVRSMSKRWKVFGIPMSRNDRDLPISKVRNAKNLGRENLKTNIQQSSHSHMPSDIALRVKALETVLTEKKLIDPSVLDEVVDRYKNKVGPQNGAKVVAKAWVDSSYKRRLLKDGSSAIAELDLLGQQGEPLDITFWIKVFGKMHCYS